MRYIEIPDFPVLRGQEAIKALHDFINEIEERKDNELTEKQIAALIKLARGLIYSIQAETRSDNSFKNIKEMRFVAACAHSPLSSSIRASAYWQALLKTRLI